MRTSIALLIALGACAGSAPASRSTEPAMPLPELTLPRIDGGTWSSTSARGSVLVIDVWASWCKPCSKGFPKLDALAARNVAVVAISLDEDPAAIRAFLAEHPLAATVVQDVEQATTKAPLRIARLPTVLVVDANGVIRHRLEEPGEAEYERVGELAAKLR